MNSITISPPHEFSFRQSLHFLSRSPVELLHKCYEDRVEKILRINGEIILFSVEQGDEQQLVIHFFNRTPTKEIKTRLRKYIGEWLGLKTDLRPFYLAASGDALLKPLVKKYFGYRIVSMPDLFECVCWAVIGQQINLTFAYLLKQRFIQQFGEAHTFNNKSYYLFPTPDAVAGLHPSQLLKLQFSRQKAEYVIGIAKAFSEKIISKEKLSKLSFEDAKNELVKLKGVGNWTANYVLMKTFNHPNAFPLEDAGLHQAIKKLLHLNEKPSLKRIEKLFKKYEGWEAYATLYLWRSLGDN